MSEPIESENNTVEYWLKWTEKQFLAADLFFGHGTDNAWDEAVQLILYVMDLPIDADTGVLSYAVDERRAQQIQTLTKQRIQSRLPLSYLINQAWFGGLSFYVDQRVLIPRSPFAELICDHFQPWITDDENVKQILEIGTGSGCMAILAALEFEHATIDAADISADALDVAKRNIAEYQLQNRINLIESDCFDKVPPKRYDIIMSNPPYVSAGEMQTLPAEYLHEPKLALEAEAAGLAIVERILQNAINYLAEDGILVVEVGNSEQALVERYPRLPFMWLELAFGGHGIFMLTAQQLKNYL